MLKTLLLGTAAVVMIAGVHDARADDLPVKAQLPATPAAYAWSGWYVGVTAGFAHGEYDTSTSTVAGVHIPTVADVATLNAAGSQAIKQTSFATGIEGGYNWQAGNWVLGLEGDLQAIHLQRASNSNSVAVPYTTVFGPSAFTVASYGNTDWLLTARPRIGYVTPNHWLVYATGGLAVTQLKSDFSFADGLLGANVPTFESGRVNTLKAGYAAGAGIEAPLTGSLSLKAEYLHVGFGNTAGQTTGNSGLEGFPPAPVFSHSSDLKADIVRAGLNYRFGDSGAAALDTPITALKSPPWKDPRSILSDWDVDTGARVWFSTGREQEGPLLGTSLPPTLNSFLTYGSLGAVSEETFARADHASGFFVKGNLGAGGINGGHLNDEDFPALFTYSNTLSSASGHLGYATIDAGYSFLKTADARLGAFVGYNYYAQGLNTYGVRQLAGDLQSTGSTGDPNILGITKYTNLNSLRVGLSSQFMLNDRLRFTGDFAYLPSVSYSGVDDHLTRQLLLPGATNTGSGVMLEAVLDYYITHNWSVGTGLRYWAWNAGLSASPIEFLASPASGDFQPLGHSVERYGVFLQSSYRWGDPAPSESTLAARAPTPASAPMNWSGLYIGGHFGGGFSNDRWSDPFGSTLDPFGSGFINVAGFGDTIRATGALGGGQIGINWQTGAWVFGAQADLSATNMTGQSSCFTGLGGVLCGRSIDALGSFTGRVGYAWDRSLAYVKGGAAWSNTTYSVLGNTEALTLGAGSTSLITTGWTAGVGIEYALTNHWTTFVEYDHIGMPATNVVLPTVAIIGAAPIAVMQSVDLFKAGMNYKFGGTATELAVKAPSLPPAPVSGWTGFYAGAELGAKWADSTWTTTSIISTAIQNTSFLDETSPQNFTFSGIRSGAYLGHNWQFAPQWVGGIELDWAYADTNTAAEGIPGCADPAGVCAAGFSTVNDLATVKLGWDASARARMGYLLSPALLIYGTGGVAWQKIETSATCQFGMGDPICADTPGNAFATVSNSTIRTGWTIGGGVETKISESLIARAEYRYSDFGTWNDIQASLNTAGAASPTNIAYQLKLHTQIATMGIAYQFGH